MNYCDQDGEVFGSQQDVKIKYLEKGKKGGKIGLMGGEETPVYDHRWELITADNEEQFGGENLIIEQSGLNKQNGIKYQGQQLMKDIQKEYSVVKTLQNVEKGKYGIQEDGSILLPQFTPAFELIQSFGIHEKFNRLFLLYFKYIQIDIYVNIKPITGFDNIDIIEHAQIQSTQKYYDNKQDEDLIRIYKPPEYLTQNKKDEWMKAVQTSDPYELSSFILQHWPQARLSVILIMDVGLKMAEVIKGDTDPVSLIFADKVSADAVYRDDIETRPYNTVTAGILQTILSGRDSSRSLKILEVGAGTEGATGSLSGDNKFDQHIDEVVLL
ncbi:MAG: hypothetical protein EZS28_019160 [Streblomastix strix]|uniref:Uncharacterized protein n=1 Tax=Streblomastix strix TaxID=222440 RepID=A0A5J4VRW7_9EUKA|nr:MAG: hypothetical protein EZS28_019160 [Streblomastix strix]